jgi:hypothetical protein
MDLNNLYQVLDDLGTYAEMQGSSWLKEKLAQLEAHIAVLENQSAKQL